MRAPKKTVKEKKAKFHQFHKSMSIVSSMQFFSILNGRLNQQQPRSEAGADDPPGFNDHQKLWKKMMMIPKIKKINENSHEFAWMIMIYHDISLISW